MRVVQLALDAELFFRLGGIEAAVVMARQRARGAHDPAIVERFCRHAPHLLAGLEREAAWEMALAAEPGPRPRLSAAQLDTAARAIADFIGLQSPHLAGHASGVAELAAGAARGLGLPEADVVAVRRAGWLQDLGRLAVSAGIWGKPGPLSDGEWERVRLYPYYTERILARPKALAPLGALAALHHERLDGSGYHRGLAAPALPLPARVLAAADVYQALTDPRPHRPARPAGEAADALRREVRAGRIDAEAANAVLAAAGHRVRSRRRGWPAGLTEREVEVLRLVARGLSNREMAQRLGLSERTVHHHIQHIYDKLGVSTRAAATLYAMQHNLLEITITG
jgi:DNA-binding CsgD family transcriptional regulator